MSKINTRKVIASLLGQKNTIVIPRIFIRVINDLSAALLLSQIIYWGERTQDKDGWFAKSYEDWNDELGLSKFQVSSAIKKLENFGVETKKRRSKFYKGAPTLHYRFNMDKIIEEMSKYLESEETSQYESEETLRTYTEITTEIIKDISASADAHTIENISEDNQPEADEETAPPKGKEQPPKASKPKAEAKPRERDAMYDAVCEHLNGIQSAEDLKQMQAADGYTTTRIGQFSNWLKGNTDSIGRGKSKQFVGKISAPAKPEHVKAFSGWLTAKLKGASLPRDPEKLIEYWREFASEARRKAEARQRQQARIEQTIQQPTGMTPEERAQALKEVDKSWQT